MVVTTFAENRNPPSGLYGQSCLASAGRREFELRQRWEPPVGGFVPPLWGWPFYGLKCYTAYTESIHSNE